MKVRASRISGIAAAGAVMLAAIGGPAGAGETADKAAEAEKLLSEGRVSEAVSAFDAAADAFFKSVPLSFRKALFVDQATGFGEYAAHAGSTFAPGSELKIYAEPVGFGWQETDGDKKIVFNTSIEIRDVKGLILAKSSEPALLEKTGRSRSRDFHITVTFQLPQLKAGDYRLLLTVTDVTTGKSAPIELPLTIS